MSKLSYFLLVLSVRLPDKFLLTLSVQSLENPPGIASPYSTTSDHPLPFPKTTKFDVATDKGKYKESDVTSALISKSTTLKQEITRWQ